MIPKKYLNPKIWQLLVTRNMALLHAHLDNEGPLLWTKLYGLKVKREGLHLNRRGHVAIFFTQRSKENFRKAIERKIKIDPNFIKKLKTELYKRGKHLLDTVKRCSKDPITPINKSKNLLKKLFEAYTKLTPALGITTILGRDVQAFLKESLKKYPDQKIDEYISILTFPDQPSPARKEEMALLTLASRIQKQARKRRLSIEKMLKEKVVNQELDKHTERFGWIPVNFIDKPWDKKFFLGQLKNLLKHYDCQTLFRQRKKSYNLSLKKRDILFKRLKLSSQSKRYIKILRETSYLNEYRKAVFCQANLEMRPFLNRIAKRIGLKDWLECCYLLPKEIIKYLDLKKSSLKTKQTVKSRYERYCLVGISAWKEPRLCDKKELAYVLRNFKVKIPKKRKIELKTLKGSTGSLGKIKGKVKVVLVGKDIPKVKKDDILVAKMTSVDFIPAMKLASAFITDEGGITCHAAIVAREMNKPCVIGTKIATRALKDGDRVEVDANRGIVRKIK